MPSYSIVIPTRNRADLVSSAVASAVAQPQSDLEIIVSDNSTTAEQIAATRRAVEEWSSDVRVRYVRPPTPLAMPDHWEFATKLARNEYVLVLQDRAVIRPGALELMTRHIDAQPQHIEIVVFGVGAGLTNEQTFYEPRHSGRSLLRPSRAVLAEFAACDAWRSIFILVNNLPRAANSAMHKNLAERVRLQHGTLFKPSSPDYTAAFLQLANADHTLQIDESLYASHGDRSNGWASLIHGTADYADEIGRDPFIGCPLQVDSVFNTTVSDYIAMDLEVGSKFPKLDLAGYLLTLWREFQLKEDHGSKLNIAEMRKVVLSMVNELSDDERLRFSVGRAVIDGRNSFLLRVRHIAFRAGVLPIIKRMASFLGLRPRQRRYHDVLDAIKAVPLQAYRHTTTAPGRMSEMTG